MRVTVSRSIFRRNSLICYASLLVDSIRPGNDGAFFYGIIFSKETDKTEVFLA